jgi:hypothetical protein
MIRRSNASCKKRDIFLGVGSTFRNLPLVLGSGFLFWRKGIKKEEGE